jgi:hypothetical protein
MCATRRCYRRDSQSWCPRFLKWIARELIASKQTRMYVCETVHWNSPSEFLYCGPSCGNTFLFVESMSEPVSTLCIRRQHTWDWTERTTLQWSETCLWSFCLLLCILLLWKPGHACWGGHELLHDVSVRRSVWLTLWMSHRTVSHAIPYIFVYVHILSSLPAPLCHYMMYIHNECIVHVLFIWGVLHPNERAYLSYGRTLLWTRNGRTSFNWT